MYFLGKVLEFLGLLSEWLTNIMMAGMAILIIVEVIARSIFNTSTLIADEYSRYLLVGVVFLGLAITFKEGHFIRVDYFYERFFSKPITRRILDVILLVIILFYLIVITIGANRMVADSFRLQTHSAFISETPMWIPQIVISIGLILLIIQVIESLLGTLIKGSNIEKGSD